MKKLICALVGHAAEEYEAYMPDVTYPPVVNVFGWECRRCGKNLTPMLTRLMHHTVAPLDLEL